MRERCGTDRRLPSGRAPRTRRRAWRSGSTASRPAAPSPKRIERPRPTAGPLYHLATVQTARLEQREPFVTADGSTIRELAGLPTGNAANQSLAEATVPPGLETAEHFHRAAEEIYLFTAGEGRMRLDGDEAPVRAGDCVVIPPGAAHKLLNPGPEPLVLLCCCAPPYAHADTVLTGG